MQRVRILDIDRPGLASALAARGLKLAMAGEVGAATFARAAGDSPGPLLVEARCADHAAALLDAGADDAVLATDPDALAAARLARLVRRGLTIGAMSIDPVDRRVTVAGRPVALLPREYAVLLHLARHAGHTVTRAALCAAVWGRMLDPGTNVIAVHVSRLRARLGPAAPRLVTDKGLGYRLALDGQDRPAGEARWTTGQP